MTRTSLTGDVSRRLHNTGELGLTQITKHQALFVHIGYTVRVRPAKLEKPMDGSVVGDFPWLETPFENISFAILERLLHTSSRVSIEYTLSRGNPAPRHA